MYNIFNWLLIICKASYKFNSNFGKIVERLEKLAEQNKEFERETIKYSLYLRMKLLLEPIIKTLRSASFLL
jgi:hypothetical protein